MPCVVFSKAKERRFGEGVPGENYNRTSAEGLGGLSPRYQRCKTSSASGSVGGRAFALCKAVNMLITCKRKEDKVSLRSTGDSILSSSKDSVPRQRGSWKDRSIGPGIFVRCVVFFVGTVRVLSQRKERRLGEGLLGENNNRIAAEGLGAKPAISVKTPHRLWFRRRSGLRPLQGSKPASNLQKKRRQGFLLDPSEILSFLLQKTVSPARERVQKTGAQVLASSYSAEFLFRHHAWSFQKEKREGMTRDSLVKIIQSFLISTYNFGPRKNSLLSRFTC